MSARKEYYNDASREGGGRESEVARSRAVVACCARRRSHERERRDAGRSPPGERGAPTDCRGRRVPSCVRDASACGRSARDRRRVDPTWTTIDHFQAKRAQARRGSSALGTRVDGRTVIARRSGRERITRDGARSRRDGDVPLLPRHDPLRAHRVDCHRGASESRRFRRVVRRSRAPSQSPSPPLLTPPRPIHPVPGHRAPPVQGVLRRLRHRRVGHARQPRVARGAALPRGRRPRDGADAGQSRWIQPQPHPRAPHRAAPRGHDRHGTHPPRHPTLVQGSDGS